MHESGGPFIQAVAAPFVWYSFFVGCQRQAPIMLCVRLACLKTAAPFRTNLNRPTQSLWPIREVEDPRWDELCRRRHPTIKQKQKGTPSYHQVTVRRLKKYKLLKTAR